MEQVLLVSALTAVSYAAGGSGIFAAPFSLISDDERGVSGTAAKLKMKVGVVSVTVEQHTEGRLQDSPSMLDLEMAACNVVRAHPRVEAFESSLLKIRLKLERKFVADGVFYAELNEFR